MIKIKIKYFATQQKLSKQPIQILIVEGHTIKINEKIEPACACVSNIVLGLLNFYKTEDKNFNGQIKVKSGYVKINLLSKKNNQIVMELAIIQLRMAVNYFPNKINLKIFK